MGSSSLCSFRPIPQTPSPLCPAPRSLTTLYGFNRLPADLQLKSTGVEDHHTDFSQWKPSAGDRKTTAERGWGVFPCLCSFITGPVLSSTIESPPHLLPRNQEYSPRPESSLDFSLNPDCTFVKHLFIKFFLTNPVCICHFFFPLLGR